MLQKLLAENVWLVMMISGAIGAILRHYFKQDYSLVQNAVQPSTCEFLRQEISRNWENRCSICSLKIDKKLADCKTHLEEISQMRKGIASVKQMQNLELWILSAMCQSINSSPSVLQKVDCKKIEEASVKLLDP